MEKNAKGLVPSDEELIERFKSGEEEAFELIAERYLGLIGSLSKKYRRYAPCSDTKDLMQEAMVALFMAVNSFDAGSGSSFKTYLSVCVENRFKSIVRASNRIGSIPGSSMISIDDESEDVFDATQSTVPEMVESKDFIRTLYRLLKDKLSDLEYKVTVLYLKGYSYREISQLLCVSEKTVENALSRTRKKISKH